MKKSHIFGIIIIGMAIMIIISTAGDASTYVSFDEAKVMADNGSQNNIHVVGTLLKDENGKIVGIEDSEDKLSFSFIMVDENSHQQKVHYPKPMPPDFIRSEQVVVVGAYDQQAFVADKILMKCPSKYQETEVKVTN